MLQKKEHISPGLCGLAAENPEKSGPGRTRAAARAAGAVLVAVLTGCASMSKEECRVADWRQVGLQDGAAGVPDRRLADYVKDCGEIGIEPDVAAYRQGWSQGVVQFCTPLGGWSAGVQGRSDAAQVCAGLPTLGVFHKNLLLGLQVHRTQCQLEDNSREINRMRRQLKDEPDELKRRTLRWQIQNLEMAQMQLRLQKLQEWQFAPPDAGAPPADPTY